MYVFLSKFVFRCIAYDVLPYSCNQMILASLSVCLCLNALLLRCVQLVVENVVSAEILQQLPSCLSVVKLWLDVVNL